MIDEKLIPRYVTRLNAMAASLGFSVRMLAEQYSNEDSGRPAIFAQWCGTKTMLLSLPMMVPHWRMPSAKGQLVLPSHVVAWHHPVLKGEVQVAGDDVVYEVDFDHVPLEITQCGPVEVVRHEKEIVYHGTADELIAHGIDRKHIPVGQRRSSRTRSNSAFEGQREFFTRRMPDGSYIYWTDAEAEFRRKLQEVTDMRAQWARPVRKEAKAARPSFLKLVWSNPGLC